MVETDREPRGIDLSVVVPAHDEESHLPATLGAARQALDDLRRERGLVGEIIVVDNDSEDRTAEVAREGGARVVFESHRQIGRARNRGARAARGRLLLFCDADTELHTALLLDAVDKLDLPSVVGGGALVAFDGDERAHAGRGLAIWNLFSRTTGFAAGCFLFVRRRDFAEAGGFDERFYAGEELLLRVRLRRRFPGRRFVILTEHRVVTSSRKTHSYAWILKFVFVALFFPVAARFRKLCGYWYGEGTRERGE